MWQLDNRTPYAAERTWVRGRDGAEIWLVAVKCTFDILPDGATKVSDQQPPVVMAPEYLDSTAAQSSLKYDMDLIRTKTTTDVLVLGHAYAPKGEPVSQLYVGFRVGALTKRLCVTGDRVWLGRSPSKPKPFTSMPLVYERAYGGIDPGTRDTPNMQWDVRNPVGTGFALSKSHIEGLKLPNIEYPDQCIRSWDDRPAPASFGPVCNHWQPRAGFAGTYDDKWQQDQFPLLPKDFDDHHYQCAPLDQQAPQFMNGGEPVALINLSEHSELIRFELPRVILGFETFFSDGERQMHDKPKLHSIILEPDIFRVSLVWQSALPCHPKVYKLLKTRIVEKKLVRLGDGMSSSTVPAEV
jgi:hypothetical protein